MTEIKPCPFCGADGDIYQHEYKVTYAVPHPTLDDYFKWVSKYEWVADCSNCNCVVGEHFNNEEDAIKAWNRRVAP